MNTSNLIFEISQILLTSQSNLLIISHLFVQVSAFHLLSSHPGGECRPQYIVVSVQNNKNHRCLCSPSTLCHLQQFPHWSSFHAHVLRFFPSQWCSLWTLCEWTRAWSGPNSSVFHTTFWWCNEFTSLQPRSHCNLRAWKWKVYWTR